MNTRRFAPPFALALLLLALLAIKLRLGLSSDDVGTAWTRLVSSNGFFSAELWSDAHFNRFPLNAAYAYALHGSLLNPPWQAQLGSWILVASMTTALFASLAAMAPSRQSLWPLAGAFLFLTSHPFAMSVFDVSCSHYAFCILFFLLAILARERRGGFWTSAALCGIGTLASEVGVFLAAQFVLLESAREGGPPWTRRRIAWLSLVALPFIASKAIVLLGAGPQALVWKAYAIRPSDAPMNVFEALKMILTPPHALPWAIVVGAFALIGARWWWVRKNEPTNTAPRQTRVLWLFALAFGLSLFPFVFFHHLSIAPRLFTETTLILVLWAPIVARACAFPQHLARMAVGVLLVSQTALFARAASDAIRAEAIFQDFLAREAEAKILSTGAFDGGLAIAYRSPVRGPLEADWGMRLLFEDNRLRQGLLGWSPLRRDQRVAVDFAGESRVCLPATVAPDSTTLVIFSDERAEPPHSLDLCDERCSNCRSTPAKAIFLRQPAVSG